MHTRPRHRIRALLACALAVGLAGCARERGPDLGPPTTRPNKTDEPVAAWVNEAPIFTRQLEAMIQADRLRPQADAEPLDELELRRQALDLLIGGELLYQAARSEGLRVPGRELDRLVGAARPQFGSDEDYRAYLESEGLTQAGLRRQVERRELLRAYARRVTDELEIDDAKARQIYEEHKERYLAPGQLRAALIFDPVSASDSTESRRQSREALETVRRRVMDGKAFATLATEHTSRFGAMAQLDTGFAERGRLHPEVDAAADQTPVGELTPVIETPRGFYLLQVLERRAARQRSFEEVRTSLLMLLARDQQDETLREHVRTLREEADVVIGDARLRPE